MTLVSLKEKKTNMTVTTETTLAHMVKKQFSVFQCSRFIKGEGLFFFLILEFAFELLWV